MNDIIVGDVRMIMRHLSVGPYDFFFCFGKSNLFHFILILIIELPRLTLMLMLV